MESVVYAKPYAGMALSTALCTAECWDWLVCLGIDFWWAIFSSACCVRVSLYTENPSALAVSRPTCWIQAPPRCQRWQPTPWGHACRYPWSAAGVSQLAIFLSPVLHREGPWWYGWPPHWGIHNILISYNIYCGYILICLISDIYPQKQLFIKSVIRHFIMNFLKSLSDFHGWKRSVLHSLLLSVA